MYLEIVHQLDDMLSPKLNDCTRQEKHAVGLFASLILSVLHLLMRICQEEINEASLRTKECKDMLQKFVKEWVTKFGGSVFGGRIMFRDKLPKYTEKELKVIYMNITVLR